MMPSAALKVKRKIAGHSPVSFNWRGLSILVDKRLFKTHILFQMKGKSEGRDIGQHDTGVSAGNERTGHMALDLQGRV